MFQSPFSHSAANSPHFRPFRITPLFANSQRYRSIAVATESLRLTTSFTFSCGIRVQWRKLIVMGRGKHERLHGDRDDLGDSQTFANIDVIEIAHFDAIHGDDVASDFELVFQNSPERFRD